MSDLSRLLEVDMFRAGSCPESEMRNILEVGALLMSVGNSDAIVRAGRAARLLHNVFSLFLTSCACPSLRDRGGFLFLINLFKI
jgi:hypothetical protein